MKGSKVDMLPGTPHTPRVILEKMIERANDNKVKSLVILEIDAEGYVNIYNTQLTLADAAWIQSQFNKRW